MGGKRCKIPLYIDVEVSLHLSPSLTSILISMISNKATLLGYLR